MSTHWYAYRSHPGKEELLWSQLLSRGFDGFYPCLRVHPVNPRAKKVRPYFPGYLFLRVDVEAVGISTFQWMPYGTGLVCFGGEPAVIPDPLVSAVRQHLARAAELGKPPRLYQRGDAVRIHAGAFVGYDAIFDSCLSGDERVRVLLKMIGPGRSLPLELPADHIHLAGSAWS